jgi:hypothetical protein
VRHRYPLFGDFRAALAGPVDTVQHLLLAVGQRQLSPAAAARPGLAGGRGLAVSGFGTAVGGFGTAVGGFGTAVGGSGTAVGGSGTAVGGSGGAWPGSCVMPVRPQGFGNPGRGGLLAGVIGRSVSRDGGAVFPGSVVLGRALIQPAAAHAWLASLTR